MVHGPGLDQCRPRNRCPVFERPGAAQAPPRKAPRTTAPSGHRPPGPARIPTRNTRTRCPYPPGHQGPRPPTLPTLPTLPGIPPAPCQILHSPRGTACRPCRPSHQGPPVFRSSAAPPGCHQRTTGTRPRPRSSAGTRYSRTRRSAASTGRPLERPGRPAGPASGHL